MSEPTISKQGPAPDINPLTPVTPATNREVLASANGTGAVNGREVPARMANELSSPNVAGGTWAQSMLPGAVDPLIQAFNENNERRVDTEALIEELEYQDFTDEQASVDFNEGQENQDPDEKGEK